MQSFSEPLFNVTHFANAGLLWIQIQAKGSSGFSNTIHIEINFKKSKEPTQSADVGSYFRNYYKNRCFRQFWSFFDPLQIMETGATFKNAFSFIIFSLFLPCENHSLDPFMERKFSLPYKKNCKELK